MPVRICAHISPAGLSCRAVTPAGQRLCRPHKSLEARARRQLRYLKPPAIRLGPLDNRQAIFRAASRIVQAIASNSIHLHRASRMIDQVQAASNRLNRSVDGPPGLSLEPLGFALTPAQLYNQPNPHSPSCRDNPLPPPTGKTK